MQSDDQQMLPRMILKKGREMLVTKGQASLKFLGRINYRDAQNSTTSVVVKYKPKCHAYVTLQKRLIPKFSLK